MPFFLLALVGCEDCDGGEGEGEGIAVEGEGEIAEGGSEGEVANEGEPACGPATPGYGTECSASGGSPLCGSFVCNPVTDELACNDPGTNACNACGDLDTAAGRPGDACGTFGCGLAVCNSDDTATFCQNAETPRNACGGCAVLTPLNVEPGDVCSDCGSGTYECTVDQNELSCFRGRSPDTQCGFGCGQCILAHAQMQDRHDGGYLLPGTLAIFEDVGGGDGVKMYFDPLIEGDGASGIPVASLVLSVTDNPFESAAVVLTPDFASALDGVAPDPVRVFTVPFFVDYSSFHYIVLIDQTGLFLDPVFSVGEITFGSP